MIAYNGNIVAEKQNGGQIQVFTPLVNTNDACVATKGDLTITIVKTSTSAATMTISFPTARNFLYGFINLYDTAGYQSDSGNNVNIASKAVRTNLGYTQGTTDFGQVVDSTNGVMYKVNFSVGNNGTSGQVNWASIIIL